MMLIALATLPVLLLRGGRHRLLTVTADDRRRLEDLYPRRVGANSSIKKGARSDNFAQKRRVVPR
jgi:hypothetical protein